MLHIPVATHATATAPNPRAVLPRRACTKRDRTHAARARIEAGHAAKGADGMDRRPAAYDAAEAVAISAAEVPPREGQTSDDAIAHGGERFRFALSVVGNTVGGAVLLAGAFALPSVFATLASLLIA